jgi:hypothetical protein
MLKAVTTIVITTWNDEMQTIEKFTNRKAARQFCNKQEHPLIIRKELYGMGGGATWGGEEPFTMIEET